MKNFVLMVCLLFPATAYCQEETLGQPAVAQPAVAQPAAARPIMAPPADGQTAPRAIVAPPAVSQPPAAEQLTDAPAFSTVDVDATLSVKEFRAELAKGIIEAAEKSEELTRGEKRRLQRVMKGGWFNEARKNTILDRVAEKMHAEGVILVTAEGVEAAIDWSSILAFIEALIPLIIKLISLFGG